MLEKFEGLGIVGTIPSTQCSQIFKFRLRFIYDLPVIITTSKIPESNAFFQVSSEIKKKKDLETKNR